MSPSVLWRPEGPTTGSPVPFSEMTDSKLEAKTPGKHPAKIHHDELRKPTRDEAPEPGMTSAYLSVFRLFYDR